METKVMLAKAATSTIFTTFAFIVACYCSTTARADWQYTRWGMTVEEALEASKGTLKRCGQACDKARTSDMNAQAFGPYRSGELGFSAYLLFDKNGELGGVKLFLNDSGQRGLLMGSLTAKYGKPARQDLRPLFETRTWYTQADEIELAVIPTLDETILLYTPGLRGSDQGL
jgi:hypothetical protein